MKKILIFVIIAIAIIVITILGVNLYVKISTNKQIITEDEYTRLKDVDCIVILGAGIWGNQPSPMLEDRLLEGINLYQKMYQTK